MSAEVFLDTNILVYCFDSTNPKKQNISKELVARKNWIVSWQVVQEFSSVALHKFRTPLKPDDLADYIELRLWPRCRVLPSEAIFQKATTIYNRYGFRFYDSLIIASALASGATKLLSEDMQHGQRIDSLEFLNPFV
ncbi:MAG: PIN domain-containing protein [Terrimicrobiaceae bacterium]